MRWHRTSLSHHHPESWGKIISPRSVVSEVVEKYLACGILKHGFATGLFILPPSLRCHGHFAVAYLEGRKGIIGVWRPLPISVHSD